MLEKIKLFCAEPGVAPDHLTEPWSDGEFTYASNGCAIVRVPRIAEVTVARPEWMKDPPNGGMAEYFDPHRDKKFVSMPDFPYWRTECPHCDDDFYTGYPLKVGKVWFNTKHLRLFGIFHDVMVLPVSSMRIPMPVKFYGGEGLIMGLNL